MLKPQEEAIRITAVLGAQLFRFPAARFAKNNDEPVSEKRLPIMLILSTNELSDIAPSCGFISRLLVAMNLELSIKLNKSYVFILSDRWQGHVHNVLGTFRIQLGPRRIGFV
ncbi:hypothetical protein DF018_30100 [Burkholderia cenocepacia]|nr:hypothetical protein DF018_30100 [Burkholderia cenocepacia]